MWIGMPSITVIRVQNLTNKTIDELGITYYGCPHKDIKLKNIKSGSSKQTGVSTLNMPKDTTLKMYTKTGYTFNIKENIMPKYMGVITVFISEVRADGSLEFKISLDI